MKKHNFAAYKPGTFSTDITNFELNGETFMDKDYSAMVHEYCHYIQDISQISSIMGFSMWMIDVAKLTQIFSDGEGKIIKIPLAEKGDSHKRYYNMYAGNPDDVFDLNYESVKFKERKIDLIEVTVNGEPRKLAVNHILLDNSAKQELHFGLIALQEMQAYYAQKMAEERTGGVTFSVYCADLPSYPYRFGDFLFRHFEIQMDDRSKFILIDLCLDTVQSPSVFLDVLDDIKGRSFPNFTENIKEFGGIVEDARKKSSHPNQLAFDNILPELEKWSNESGRKYLTQAIKWYLNLIHIVMDLKQLGGKTFLSHAFAMDNYNLGLLFQVLTPPVYVKDGVFYRNKNDHNPEADSEFIKDFEAATTLWSHKILYDLLTSTNKDELNSRCQCPLYDNCKDKMRIEEEYTCRTAPWEVIKNGKKITCQYGMAAHSFGLWQNTLEIDFEATNTA